MSDPARDGYQCHGAMTPVVIEHPELPPPPHAWWCHCGVWRHALPASDPHRAMVTLRMEQQVRHYAAFDVRTGRT